MIPMEKQDELRYDKAAKEVLSEKKILAWILKHTVPEFKKASLEDIASKYIEGKPKVGIIPVMKDKTNLVLGKQETELIQGSQNEDNSITEGSIVFDVLFRAISPVTGEPVTLIINIEAQHSIHPTGHVKGKTISYPLLKRAVYYISRLISSQKETVFSGSDYGKIQKVYSIWICMEGPEGQSAINRYQLKETHVLHRYKEPAANYDLMGIIFVYLGNQKVRNKLINMLKLLFVEKEMTVQQKLDELKEKYNVEVSKRGKEDLSIMCNLGEGLVKNSIQQGLQQGMKQGLQQGMKQGLAIGEKRGETKLGKLISLLAQEERIADISKAAVDPDYREKLYKEYHIE